MIASDDDVVLAPATSKQINDASANRSGLCCPAMQCLDGVASAFTLVAR